MGLAELPFSIIFSRLVNVSPNISKQGNLLVVTSNWRAHVLSLGFGSRKVVVDPQSRIVRLKVRRFWFFTAARRIEFDWVHEIAYGYSDLAVAAPITWAHQADDLYAVGLWLKNGEVVNLCRFFGKGEFINESLWPDWFYWQDTIESNLTHGDQDSDSLAFADTLSRIIGVPIGNPD